MDINTPITWTKSMNPAATYGALMLALEFIRFDFLDGEGLYAGTITSEDGELRYESDVLTELEAQLDVECEARRIVGIAREYLCGRDECREPGCAVCGEFQDDEAKEAA